MPGEFVDHVYAGPMERETIHFLEAVAYDREVMVQPRLARMTMEIYLAADLSVETGQVVELPTDTKVLRRPLRTSIHEPRPFGETRSRHRSIATSRDVTR